MVFTAVEVPPTVWQMAIVSRFFESRTCLSRGFPFLHSGQCRVPPSPPAKRGMKKPRLSVSSPGLRIPGPKSRIATGQREWRADLGFDGEPRAHGLQEGGAVG